MALTRSPDYFDVELDDAEAMRRLGSFELQMRDLRPFWPKVVPLFIGWMAEVFDTEGGFWAGPWAALSPRYAAWKSRRYPGKPILQAEGDLRRAASEPTRDVTPDSITLTIVDEKVQYHFTGTPRMPARPLFTEQLPSTAVRDLEDAAEDYVVDAARRLGIRTRS